MANTNIKYTQKDIYTAILANADSINGIPESVITEFCEKKLSQLETKSSKTDTKKTSEHRAVMDKIIAVLCKSADGKMKCTALTNAVNAEYDTEYTPSKINAMLKKMLPSDEKNPDGTGEIVRIVDKKDVYFALAE